MATTKKTTTKKKTTRSAAAKTSARKAPVKKTTVRKSPAKRTSKSAKAQSMQSFRVARDNTPFSSFQVTRQTIYWIILVAFIIFAQLWILKLQVEVSTLIEAQQAQLQNF